MTTWQSDRNDDPAYSDAATEAMYLEAERRRVAVRRYELTCECIDILVRFMHNAPTVSLYADYRREWERLVQRKYAEYYAAFGKYHPDTFG